MSLQQKMLISKALRTALLRQVQASKSNQIAPNVQPTGQHKVHVKLFQLFTLFQCQQSSIIALHLAYVLHH